MSIVLNLPTELESELTAEAAQFGLPLPEYVLRLLAEGRAANPTPPRTGAELLAYWQKEGIIGTRAEITESSTHARALRERAQKRERE